MSARKIRGHWYIDFRHEYQRVRKRSPENSRAGTLAYEATLRGRLARGQPMIPAPRQPTAKPRFEIFAWRWYAIYVETNNKPSEQKAKRLILKNHLVPSFGTLTLDAITTLKAEEFKAAKLNAGLAPKSINNFLAVLGKCLRTAEEWNELDRVPKLKLLRVPPQTFDFLSREEADQLIRAVQDQHWRAMITVALRTGLRLGELVALDWSDVNLETRLLTVRRSAFGNQIVSPKSNRIRHIPLTGEVQRTLQPIRRSSGLVFSRSGTTPLNDQVARRAIARLRREAGIRHIGWHVLRHTFASHLVTAGVSIKAVQELLGHSDVRTTMRYAHLAPSALQDAVRVLEPTVASDDILGQPVGTALTPIERKKTETPQFTGRF
jgi:integrase